MTNLAANDWRIWAAFSAVAFALGCGGGASDSEVQGSTGGSGSGTGGGSNTGGNMNSNTGGAAGECPPQTNFTLGVHIVMDATWPGTLASEAGTGKIHLWTLAVLNADGTTLSGQTISCGTELPEFRLSFLGGLVAGGQKVKVDVPFEIWDKPSMPKFTTQGTIAGWNAGDTLKIEGTRALVGLTMTDPEAAWPTSFEGITTADADGDGNPGFTAVPKTGDGYVAPPVALSGSTKATKLYLVSRTIVSLDGELTACNDQAGSATVTKFDSHVVGCYTSSNENCLEDETNFVDSSRTDYKISSATFKSTKMADGASCSDVREALPMQ